MCLEIGRTLQSYCSGVWEHDSCCCQKHTVSDIWSNILAKRKTLNSSLPRQHELKSRQTSDREMNIVISAGVSVGW